MPEGVNASRHDDPFFPLCAPYHASFLLPLGVRSIGLLCTGATRFHRLALLSQRKETENETRKQVRFEATKDAIGNKIDVAVDQIIVV